MATLELGIDEDVAVSPVRRTPRLGLLFWVAIAWIILIFAAAGLIGVLPLPSPTDMDMLERRGAAPALPSLCSRRSRGGRHAPLFFCARGYPIFWFISPVLSGPIAVGRL